MAAAKVLVALVGLVCLLGETMGETVFVLQYRDKRELMDLIEMLSGLLVDQIDIAHDVNADTARLVAALLAETKDKAKPRAILNEFSVNQLLELNTWNTKLFNNDCSASRLKKRVLTCHSIHPIKDDTWDYKDPNSEEPDPETEKEEQIRFNLGKYCWFIIDFLVPYCVQHHELDQFFLNDIVSELRTN